MSLIHAEYNSYINIGDVLYITKYSTSYHFTYNEDVDFGIHNQRLACSEEEFHSKLKNAGFIQGFIKYFLPGREMLFINVSKILYVYNIYKINGITKATVRFMWKKRIDSMEFEFLGTPAELQAALVWRPTLETQRQLDELRADVMHMPGGPVFQAAAASFNDELQRQTAGS